MNTLAAAVLLHLAGKPIDDKSVTAVIESAGGKADAAAVKKIVAALAGKDVMKFARENLSKVGGGSGATTSAPVEAKKEEKKDEKKDDKKGGKPADKKKEKEVVVEEEDDAFAGGLF